MKIERKRTYTEISYSANCVLCACLLTAIKLLEVKISLLGSLIVLGIGLTLFTVAWLRLGCRLGICPNIFHSTSCVPQYKHEKILFRSSGVLEIGIANGIFDTILLYAYMHCTSSLFFTSFCVFSILSLKIDHQQYWLSDVFGSICMFFSLFYHSSFTISQDYIFQIILCIGFGKQLVLSQFKSQLLELRSIVIVSSMTQGLILSIFSYFYLPFGTLEDCFFPVLSILFTYTLLDSTQEKLSNFYSILTLPIYAFDVYLNYVSIIFSTIGCIFLIFGVKICSFCSTRINFPIKSSTLRESLL